MIVSTCKHERVQKNSKHPNGATRFRCALCGKSWTEDTDTLGGMRIGLDKAAKVIELLCEGMSVLGTSRITGVAKRTILDLLLYVGPKCDEYMQANIKSVFVDSVQVDEIWQFVFCKKATAKREKYVGGCGDSYCFTGVDRTTKLLVAWHMGRRTEEHTNLFMAKLNNATAGHFHVSTDGFKSYPTVVNKHLGNRVDHGVMIKVYGRHLDDDMRRYSPARILSAERVPMHGDTYQHDQICTSHVERHNCQSALKPGHLSAD